MNATRKIKASDLYESPQTYVFVVQAEATVLTTSQTVKKPEGYDGYDDEEFEW